MARSLSKASPKDSARAKPKESAADRQLRNIARGLALAINAPPTIAVTLTAATIEAPSDLTDRLTSWIDAVRLDFRTQQRSKRRPAKKRTR